MNSIRFRVGLFVGSSAVRNFVLGVILVNAALLGMQTSPSVMAKVGFVVDQLDGVCLSIFVIELLLKLFSQGFRFFNNGWNIFDFFVVGISLVPGGQGLSVLRALRVLRVLRVLSVAPSLRRVVEGLIRAMPGMGSVFLLMSIIFYIGSVMATKLFGHDFPEWFGTIGSSAYSLFQIMTLESWSMGIVRPVMELHPYAWAFFVPFIMVTTFTSLNLIVGLVVASMQEAHEAEHVDTTVDYREEVLARLEAIEKRLTEK